ncbi:MAG: hypothetical protein ACYCT1_19735 [Steroidobacteraceae bacterium]
MNSVRIPYRARTLKPRERRSAAQLAQLDAQIMAVLRADHPQSVRHVFYRMTDPRLPESVEKSDRGYRHVQARCVALRRNGRLPYGWLSDTGRMGYFVDVFSGRADFVRRMAGMYRADLWADAECRCEVWCESRSIAGVILADCQELAVSLYPCGGFTSITFAHDAAQAMNAADDDRETVVFYVGDYDPAGVLIDVALERELRTHLRPDVRMQFVRLGITLEQVEQYDLPKKPRKESDHRSLEVDCAVEAEAMPAASLRKILRAAIEALLPPHALAVAKVAEESERDGLRRIAMIEEIIGDDTDDDDADAPE